MSSQTRVLFLVPYPVRKAPSQRFRVELFLPTLQKARIPYRIEPFLDAATGAVLYSQASFLRKGFGVVKGFLRRLFVVLFIVPRYDYIFVHREASPVGPPIFEFIIAKLWRKRLIYDFDDAIWIPNTSNENKLASWIKAFWKVKHICRWSYKVAAGNEFLCRYARHYNPSVSLVPTCVDIALQHNLVKDQYTPKIVIGWTGSHSTMKYLDDLLPVLQRISAEFDVEVVIISNKPPLLDLPNLRFVPWTEDTEIQDLLQLNIGLMPLEADEWSAGKCGFKIIQYLSLGIPAVASPVGVNATIVDGHNGFLCSSEEDWYAALSLLITDAQLRSQLGQQGREKVVREYSVQANEGRFLALFN